MVMRVRMLMLAISCRLVEISDSILSGPARRCDHGRPRATCEASALGLDRDLSRATRRSGGATRVARGRSPNHCARCDLARVAAPNYGGAPRAEPAISRRPAPGTCPTGPLRLRCGASPATHVPDG